ncbi:MAG: type II secretion system F family protein [Rickettsiales bacterium]|nr:type II secretion system F family protein [Rickettsiales bacterium]
MSPLLLAVIIGIICFLLVLVVTTKMGRGSHSRASQMLTEMSNDMALGMNHPSNEEGSILKADYSDSPVLKFLSEIPLGEKFGRRILGSGMARHATLIVVLLVVSELFVPYVIYSGTQSLLFTFLAFIGVPYAFSSYLQNRIASRNAKFISDFPDVLDMIVRSVRSGFPLNTALNMVAENMEAPISTEFRQVVDEIALGRTSDEALLRLSQRVEEQDVKFFIVVLRVQQETGGNLAEVVSNLSNVIRKRKQLRLKIRAMTSEGRATSYILGAIPVVMFLALYLITPDHLDPLLTTETGHMLLTIVAALIITSQVVVRKMIKVEV